MNKVIPIVLLFGGLTIFGGFISKAISPPAFEMTTQAVTSTVEAKQATTSADMQSIELKRINLDKVEPMEESKPNKTVKTKFDLNNVNGISLNDNVEIVIEKLGQPISIDKDSYTPELIVYTYEEMNIGFSDGIVSYVEVLVAAGTVKIDGISLRIDSESLKKALGEPDFVAEDGIVFQRNVFLVKLFTDMETHEVTSLHYYHHSNT
ncbi:hypothetical protein EHS13_29035 [Paenibacillus psychroresistens]|uniref:DUF4309 domain-containing protein n=1 Tax=Paenibacillus psychroresistens TaxID=1778678 RepID=A0A6B8RRQ1_9BACL|nr:hypothetical protein [Paenibacillus psychroresistens]QGQ98639.1 hypothetical protein EHS13_29035 [Paenibacillus psychroresistens]